MAINEKNDICEYALHSLSDVISFARFVSYAEDLPQLNELFENEHNMETAKSRPKWLKAVPQTGKHVGNQNINTMLLNYWMSY